jgi:hypothetical protein
MGAERGTGDGVTRLVEVDLDDTAGIERLWAELQHARAIRDADPPLRVAILRRCDGLSAEVAAPILTALDELHPEVVLEAYFTSIVPKMPTVGYWRRHYSRALEAAA